MTQRDKWIVYMFLALIAGYTAPQTWMGIMWAVMSIVYGIAAAVSKETP